MIVGDKLQSAARLRNRFRRALAVAAERVEGKTLLLSCIEMVERRARGSSRAREPEKCLHDMMELR